MKIICLTLIAYLALSPRCLALPDLTPEGQTKAVTRGYEGGCLFTAMRFCAERWPVGPNNRYKCYNNNIELCELEAQAFKKWLDQK